MVLKDFLLKYRIGVRAATGKVLSINRLVHLMLPANRKLDQEFSKKLVKRFEQWEAGNGKPKEDVDRIIVKTFFGIDDFDNIKEGALKEAIARYPKGMADAVILHDTLTETQTDENQLQNVNTLLNNELSSLSTKDQLMIIDRILTLLEQSSAREDRLAGVIDVLARKVPDVETVKDEQTKKGRAV